MIVGNNMIQIHARSYIIKLESIYLWLIKLKTYYSNHIPNSKLHKQRWDRNKYLLNSLLIKETVKNTLHKLSIIEIHIEEYFRKS